MSDPIKEDGPYRRATEEEKRGRCSEGYDLLIGPDGFMCLLTEPEDRTWGRDGALVIAELNRLHALIARLEKP